MIPVFRPAYDEREVSAVRDVLMSGWTGLGPRVAKFEKLFAEYIGVKYAVATDSCTGALHLALASHSALKPGCVITSPISFISTTHAIRYVDRAPHFADVEYDTLNMDIWSVPDDVLSKASAIMCVHFGGHACDMDAIMHQARKFGLLVVEDVAHGCGGKHNESMLGSIGDVGCFSFQAVKNLSCGDGGMLTTNNPDICRRAKILRWVGIDKSTWDRTGQTYDWDYDVSELGYKYNMNDITAAIGMVQLDKLEDANARRRELAQRYNKLFRSSGHVVDTPYGARYATSSWHNYVVKVQHRDRLHQYLKDRGIGSSVHYKPHNQYKMYAGYGGRTLVVDGVWKNLLTLPLYPGMTEDEQDEVVGVVCKFMEMEENCK